MKINKAKLLVGTLAIAAVAATVGSISGTVAWFQYSTRVTAAYEGATAHCTENLQIRLYQPAVAEVDDGDHVYDKDGEHAAIPFGSSDWKQDLSRDDIKTFLTTVRGTTATNKLTPVTSGKLAADAVPTKLYKNPIYQYAATSSWGEADATDYIDLPLQFRVLDVNGNNTTETYLAKKIYLSDITFAAQVAGKDMSSALRVVVDNGAAGDAAFKQTFSKTGDAVTVGGNLDLNNDKVIDKVAGYEWDTSRGNVEYGDWTEGVADKAMSKGTAETDKADDASDLAIADDSDPLKILGKPLFTSTSVSDTPANIATKTEWAGIKLRIYLEGWTTLDKDAFGNDAENATPTTVWDEMKVVGDAEVVFRLGLRFTAEAHADHA